MTHVRTELEINKIQVMTSFNKLGVQKKKIKAFARSLAIIGL